MQQQQVGVSAGGASTRVRATYQRQDSQEGRGRSWHMDQPQWSAAATTDLAQSQAHISITRVEDSVNSPAGHARVRLGWRVAGAGTQVAGTGPHRVSHAPAAGSSRLQQAYAKVRAVGATQPRKEYKDRAGQHTRV